MSNNWADTFCKKTKGNVFETLLYNTFDHPHILKPLSNDFDADRISSIYLPRGKVPSPAKLTKEERSEYIASVLSALLYMEGTGMCHGDVKINNTIMRKVHDGFETVNKFYLIDFDLVYLKNTTPSLMYQTYGDDVHRSYLESRDYDDLYNPPQDYMWAIGYFIYSVYTGVKREISLVIYNRIARNIYNKQIFDEDLGPWDAFIRKCMSSRESRPESIKRVYEHIPRNIQDMIHNINKDLPKPNFFMIPDEAIIVSENANEALQRINNNLYPIREQTTNLCINLYTRLISSFKRLIKSKGKVFNDDVIEIGFLCICFYLAGVPVSEFDSLPSIFYNAGLYVEYSDIHYLEKSTYELINWKLPNYFIKPH